MSNQPPPFELPLPESPEIITANAIAINQNTSDPRTKLIFANLVRHLHAFVKETNITTEEWMKTIQFLTRTGQTCTNIRQEFILLSDILGVSALVDALNNPPTGNSTESTVLGPFFTDDAQEIPHGDTIASEGKGTYLYVRGRILNTSGAPIPNVTIETWETDANGFYDTQYADRQAPDCRGRLRSGEDGTYKFRAVVPIAYPIPGDGPVGELLANLNRHIYRPAHLHFMFEAPGYEKLVTSLYPEGDKYLNSDAVFGVKKSLVISLKHVKSEVEARNLGFPSGDSFYLLEHDFILATVAEAKTAREKAMQERGISLEQAASL